ncbi:unnamed protein product, partial [Tetraodon nigroviridis]
MSSTSENSTEPWFCDACKNGVTPSCELCPNQDGIFKETDAGRWVHVVCALYVPGVAFGDIDKLRPVTLTEMNYSKYGAKARVQLLRGCPLRPNWSAAFARMPASPELVCASAVMLECVVPISMSRVHRGKDFCLRLQQKRILPILFLHTANSMQTVLTGSGKGRITLPYSLTVKFLCRRERDSCLLRLSASAIRKLMRKAELMGISTDIFPVDTSDANASLDGRRKHKQPALSAEFVNYYLERNIRMIQIQDNISEQKSLKDKLESEQEKLHVEYSKLCESLEELLNVNGELRSEGQAIWTLLGGILGQ